jgi:hypothetical protein
MGLVIVYVRTDLMELPCWLPNERLKLTVGALANY